MPNTASWQSRQPHLTKIAALCEKFFSWGSSGDIVSRFKNTLWPGIAIQHLLQVRNIILYS
jgi:Holliday junction resolvase YEN1